MYKIFHGELIDDGLVYSHAGGPPLMAIDSFIDVKHQGEAAYSARTLKEYYALPIYRAHYNPQQYGFMVEHTWQNRAAIARNSTWGVALLHDNAIKMYFHAALQRHYHADNNRGKHGIDWKMWVPHRWFDWADSQWYPYYRNGDVLSIDGEEVYGSFHLNAKKQIIFNMMNMGTKRQAVKVAFDANNLGLPATLHARDVVTDEVFEVPNGRFEIKILGERPRILLMATQPVKLPGD
jgi:hypothetical protein